MMSPACMFSVAIIHLFRLPPANRAMSADLCSTDDDNRLCSECIIRVPLCSESWPLPARVVSHFHNLLFKGFGLIVWFIAQSLKVNPPVFLFVASTDAMCPYPSCAAERKVSKSLHSPLVAVTECGQPEAKLISWSSYLLVLEYIFQTRHADGSKHNYLPSLKTSKCLVQHRTALCLAPFKRCLRLVKMSFYCMIVVFPQ